MLASRIGATLVPAFLLVCDLRAFVWHFKNTLTLCFSGCVTDFPFKRVLSNTSRHLGLTIRMLMTTQRISILEMTNQFYLVISHHQVNRLYDCQLNRDGKCLVPICDSSSSKVFLRALFITLQHQLEQANTLLSEMFAVVYLFN
jgi:hypothetical protein